MRTEFVIQSISDSISTDGNKKAILVRRTDSTRRIYAQIKVHDADVGADANVDVIIVCPTNANFSRFTSDPFVCSSQENVSFTDLTEGGILTSLLF